MSGPEAESTYRIEVQGKIDAGWSEWLDRMTIRYDHDRTGAPVSILVGTVTDQSALRGLLTKLWNLNLSVLAVQRVENAGAGSQNAGGM